MTEKQRIKNNERAKAWNQVHKNDPKLKSRRKKYYQEYHLKNKNNLEYRKRLQEQRKKYYQTHKEQIMARVRKWRQEKKNKINQLKENK